VRLNGRVYEAIKARLDRRQACDLYHSGLTVSLPEGRYVIEMTPIVDGRGRERGLVAEGPVGARWAIRFRMFRYELRRWRNGRIPDLNEAVDSPRRLSSDPRDAERLLELVPQIPMLVRGRDEIGAGEMWNSNSTIAWLIARTGLDVDSIAPPPGGRAPGWKVGVVAAQRSCLRQPVRCDASENQQLSKATVADTVAILKSRECNFGSPRPFGPAISAGADGEIDLRRHP
jgi:hypothetical protein